ncbi:MAG: DNA polymerase I, partial [Mitsuokella jalaludinii]|nr:DNA polymerase I [Mitsuokella jalaludinii]
MKQEQNGKQKRFLVLDGSSLIFRAFYALPGLSDSHGQPTGAIFGFSNMLTKLMAEQQPDLMVLAFDKSRHTFRTERYADYKGTRDKTPEELLSQFPLLREFAANMGIPFLEKDNYEADDIIGTLATQAAAKGYDVRVITGDRDALQLVRPNLRVLLTKKGISEIKDYDTAAFEEEYGFEPLKLIDLKGLMGDTSDNIPGVPGVGPKTASKLLLAYGSVENVLAHVGEVSGKKLKENLQTYADQARLSKELATIELHVPDLAFAEEDYRIQPDMEKMQAFCDDHELRAVWRNFERLYGPAELALDLDGGENGVAAQDLSYDLWDEAAVKTAARAPYLAVSGIFSGLAPFASLEGLAVVAGPDAEKAGFVARDSAAFPALLQLLESDQQAVVFGLKRYDQAGLRGQKAFFDVELAAYLLEPERSKYALSELSQKYLQEAAPESFDDEKAQAVWEAKTISRLYPLLGAKLEEEELTHLMDT